MLNMPVVATDPLFQEQIRMPNIVAVAAALVLAGGFARPNIESVLPACPEEQPRTRGLVEKLLTATGHESSRQEMGLVGVSPASVRLLTEASDAAACNALHPGGPVGTSGPWRWTFYTAGGKYFVAFHYVDAPGANLRVGFKPLLVYDANFQRIGEYAM
jgi:hypothetical protein